MKQTIKKISISLLALILALSLPLCKAYAKSGGTLSVSYPYDGASFHVFRVGGAVEGGYRLEGGFAGYDVAIPGERWLDTAATLAVYAQRDKLDPDAAQNVLGGTVVFSGLEEGMYLVTGDAHSIGSLIYTPVPFLAWVPASGTVTAEEKYDIREECPETVSYSVIKIWKDGKGEKRPGKVSVQLLKDGIIYDTVELNEKNGWTYAWNNLDAAAEWKAAEKEVPENYTVSVSQDGTAFIVTNIFCEPGEPPKPPDEGIKTGDTFEMGIYGCLTGIALIAAALVFLLRKHWESR